MHLEFSQPPVLMALHINESEECPGVKKYFQNGYDFFFCLVQTLFLLQKNLEPISYAMS